MLVLSCGPGIKQTLSSAQGLNPKLNSYISYYIAQLEAVLLTKCFVFDQVLAVSVRFIQKDAEERKVSFNARPYFRLFINWLLDLGSMDPVFDGANFQVWFLCFCFVNCCLH